jgi:hypothetical protein
MPLQVCGFEKVRFFIAGLLKKLFQLQHIPSEGKNI